MLKKKLLQIKINKQVKKEVYFIGIKGVGMTMLAQFLQAKGDMVSGSDVAESFLTDKVLRDAKIKVYNGFSPDNIPGELDLIVYSSAYNEKNNPELGYIKNNKKDFSKVKLLSYAEALGEVFNTYQGISVCGSHGKTTTSAWLGYVLQKANKKPNVLVGSRVPQFKGSSLIGSSKIFIAETDEYQNKLRFFNPFGVVLNNIDYDHPDFFKDKASYIKVFRDFIKRIPETGFLVANYGDIQVKKVSKSCLAKIISYDLETETLKTDFSRRNKAVAGTDKEVVNYFAFALKIKGLKQSFQINNLGEFKISLLGRHNIKNALAVIAAALELGVSLKDIKKHLSSFKGTERRSQILGTYNQAIYIDDYAHHPTEIQATLESLKTFYHTKKIITVFHPHTFTRTKALFNDFVRSFKDTDELIVLDIYGSAREKQGGITSAKLVKEINTFYKKEKRNIIAKNIKTLKEVASYLKLNAKSNDLVVLMGAGDVFRVWEYLKKS